MSSDIYIYIYSDMGEYLTFDMGISVIFQYINGIVWDKYGIVHI